MEMDTYEHIQEQWAIFNDNHEKHQGGNKAAGGRARKALGEIKKLVTQYRKESIAADKSGE